MASGRSFMLAGIMALAIPLAGSLAGCAGVPGGAPLVSAHYPPGVNSSSSEPQPLGSLPVGAANLSTAPGGYQPNVFAWTFRAI